MSVNLKLYDAVNIKQNIQQFEVVMTFERSFTSLQWYDNETDIVIMYMIFLRQRGSKISK